MDELDALLASIGPETGKGASAPSYQLRTPCKRCGGLQGRVQEKGAQDTVWCGECGAYQYNAPRTETGKPVRTVKTREAFKPALRARILARDGGCCVLCKRDDEPLHVGHLLSVKEGKALGLTEEELNQPENLAAMCDACNLGLSEISIPLRLWAAILRIRAANPGPLDQPKQ